MQQPRMTSELLKHAKQIGKLYDAKYRRGERKQRPRCCPVIPFSWQIKREEKEGGGVGWWGERMLFNFVYLWELETFVNLK